MRPTLMLRGAVAATALALTTSCGSKAAPATAESPARGLRNLSTADAEVSAIAVEAARSIQVDVNPSMRPSFAGVFVGGKRMREATDAVLRATGFTASSGRAVTPECRATNTRTGQSTPVPCPPTAVQYLPPILTFVEMRATRDSAYVGLTERTNTAAKDNCIILRMIGGGWKVTSTSNIADARQCGR